MLTYLRYFAREETYYGLAASAACRTAQEIVAQDWRANGGAVPTSCRGLSQTPEVVAQIERATA